MAALKDLIVSGPGRILGPLYSDSFIKTNGTSSQILLADGNTLAKSDIVSYSQTVDSTTTGAYEIGKITINGTETTIYGKDTGGGGGGASELKDLSDVTINSNTLNDGQILLYDSTLNSNTGGWRNTPGPIILTGTCNDSSSTSKTVSIDGVTELINGLLIRVMNSSTAADTGVTLNVNSLGAKPIRVNKNGSYEDPGKDWGANMSYLFLYDSINDRWLMIGRDYNNSVTQTYIGSSYTNWRKVVLSYANSSSSGVAPSSQTNTTYVCQYVEVKPSTGQLRAKGFIKSGASYTDGILLANGNDIEQSTFEPALPAHTASDSGKTLSIDSGNGLEWTRPVTIYTGDTPPTNEGVDGDIYIQTIIQI